MLLLKFYIFLSRCILDRNRNSCQRTKIEILGLCNLTNNGFEDKWFCRNFAENDEAMSKTE